LQGICRAAVAMWHGEKQPVSFVWSSVWSWGTVWVWCAL